MEEKTTLKDNVLKGLKVHVTEGKQCEDCPYDGCTDSCMSRLLADVYALMKDRVSDEDVTRYKKLICFQEGYKQATSDFLQSSEEFYQRLMG